MDFVGVILRQILKNGARLKQHQTIAVVLKGRQFAERIDLQIARCKVLTSCQVNVDVFVRNSFFC